jgi:hypothetical protein
LTLRTGDRQKRRQAVAGAVVAKLVPDGAVLAARPARRDGVAGHGG